MVVPPPTRVVAGVALEPCMWGHPLALQREPMWWLSGAVVLLWQASAVPAVVTVTMVVTAFSHQTGLPQTQQTVAVLEAVRP